jgi:hypothetical protein
MPIYKGVDLVNNAPKFVAMSLNKGSGRTNQSANNDALYANSTINAFVNTQTIGVMAATPTKMANTTGEGSKVTAPGWNLRRVGQGPIVTVVVANGALFANGSTLKISGGTSDATVVLTTNATGNLVSAAVNTGAAGIFSNNSSLVYAFQREKLLKNLTVTGGSGYDNTDTIRVSNATVNATATLVTNSIGGFGNVDITLTNVGLFANTKANTDVVIAVLAANGGASNGSSATLLANLQASTGGAANVSVLGGRAGRVHYECLVEMSSLQSNNTASSANSILPEA